MCAHHIKFVARTVLVRNNDVEAAYRALDRLVGWSIGDGSLMRTVTRGLSKNRRDNDGTGRSIPPAPYRRPVGETGRTTTGHKLGPIAN